MTLILSGTTGITDVDGTASAPAITGTDTDTGVFFPSANTLGLSTGGTERARVDSSGNLGLGVTPPTIYTNRRAFVIGGQTVASVYHYAGIGESAYNWYLDSSAAVRYATSNYAGTFEFNNSATGGFAWKLAPSGTAGNVATFTQAMTLDASGNLGIGTTSPIGISGYTTITVSNATNGGAVLFAQAGTQKGAIFSAGNNVYLDASNSAGNIYFRNTGTGATTTIDSSGNLLVGTTSLFSGGERLAVGSASSDWNTVLRNTHASGPYGLLLQYTAAAPNGTTNSFIYASDSSALRFQVRSNGGIANFSANNVNLSDQREKKEIQLAGNYLDKICAIPVKTFLFNDQTDTDKNLGVIAQDVQAVAPELVMESNWAKEGDEPKMRLSIYQTDLQYALMKCIQEQQALITQLQADVAALKG